MVFDEVVEFKREAAVNCSDCLTRVRPLPGCLDEISSLKSLGRTYVLSRLGIKDLEINGKLTVLTDDYFNGTISNQRDKLLLKQRRGDRRGLDTSAPKMRVELHHEEEGSALSSAATSITLAEN